MRLSTVYYALFHYLARCAADTVVGALKARRSERAWRHAYRALEHREEKNKFQNEGALRDFVETCRTFVRLFVDTQARRRYADYDPAVRFRRADALRDIRKIERAMRQFDKVPAKDRPDFAVYAIMRHRKRL